VVNMFEKIKKKLANENSPMKYILQNIIPVTLVVMVFYVFVVNGEISGVKDWIVELIGTWK
jgi:hypothetical protein